MTRVNEDNWRLHFWNTWESWDDDQEHAFLRLFPNPVVYMKWAETPHAEFGHKAPWEFVRSYGTYPYLEYLRDLATRDYWDKVCREWVDRQTAKRA